MLHRQVIAVLGLPGKGGYHYSDTKIFKDCEIINKCERISSNAEKMTSKRAIAEYHEGDLDKVFEVTVSGVSLLGLSVKIADTHAEGLVFSEELKAIGYQLNEQQTEIVKVVGRGVPIRLGTKLNVRLKEVDILRGRLSFEFLSFADIQPVLDFKDIIAA
jgi:exoribonuclease R